MFEFDEKKYFYLFVLLPVMGLIFAWYWFWKYKKQKSFGSKNLLSRLAPETSVFKPSLKFFLVLLTLSALTLALVNPKIGSKMETVKREGIDIVFAVDVSKSMLAEDVAPNRLEKTKQIVSQIINQLGNDRIGIVAYAGAAFPLLPITTDYGVAKMYLQSMNTDMVSSMGTSLQEALDLSLDFFDEESETSKLIVLISDGEDHEQGWQAAVERAYKMNAKIISIGVGTEKGGPIPLKRGGVVQSFKRDWNDEVVITQLNQENLKQIAAGTKGGYVLGNNTKEVLDYVNKALENIEKTEFETTQVADFKSQFQWFLGIAFVLLWIDLFLLERKTAWISKLNLFNEKKK